MEPKWIQWAKRLQAISQTGLNYAQNHYQLEQFEQVKQIAAEMMSQASDFDSDQLVTLFERESGYATPKVDVRGVVFREEKILLVKELVDGKWTLPGGWADVAESPTESVVREVYEESGYRVKPLKLAAVYDRSKHSHTPYFPFHVYKMFFICEFVGGKAEVNAETVEPTFFDKNDIPELSESRVIKEQIARMYEHYRDPAIPTDFD